MPAFAPVDRDVDLLVAGLDGAAICVRLTLVEEVVDDTAVVGPAVGTGGVDVVSTNTECEVVVG
jgi:hypothetical protein